MAKNKPTINSDGTFESFIFYRSFYDALKLMTPEQVKESVILLCEYGLNNSDNENSDDMFVNMFFAMAKPQLKANHKKAKDGSKGGRPPKSEETYGFENNNQWLPNEEPNENHNDNENDNENENVNVNNDYDYDCDNSDELSPENVFNFYHSEKLCIKPDEFWNYNQSKGWKIFNNDTNCYEPIFDWKKAYIKMSEYGVISNPDYDPFYSFQEERYIID